MKKGSVFAFGRGLCVLTLLSLMPLSTVLSHSNLKVSNVHAAKGPSGITVSTSVTNTGTQGCGPFTFTLGLNCSDGEQRFNPLAIAWLAAGATHRRSVSFPLYTNCCAWASAYYPDGSACQDPDLADNYASTNVFIEPGYPGYHDGIGLPVHNPLAAPDMVHLSLVESPPGWSTALLPPDLMVAGECMELVTLEVTAPSAVSTYPTMRVVAAYESGDMPVVDFTVIFTPPLWSDTFTDCDIGDWDVQTSSGSFAPTTVYVSSPCGLGMVSQGSGYAYGKTPDLGLDTSQDYTISFQFKVPNSNNHWFLVMDNGHVHVVIDYGTDLKVRYGESNYPVQTLAAGQWYGIECKVHPSSDTYDVYVGGTKKLTAGFAGNQATSYLRIGDIHDGSYDHGEGFWDDIHVAGSATEKQTVCKIIPQVPDENQPPASGSTNWCAPTAAVNIVDYWDRVMLHSNATGLMDGWARNQASDDIGWFMDTSNAGSASRGNGADGHAGTYARDEGPGLLDFVRWDAANQLGHGAPPQNKSGYLWQVGTDYNGGWNTYIAEIDSGRPSKVDFLFWNPLFAGLSIVDSATGEILDIYEWGSQIPSSLIHDPDNPAEDWNLQTGEDGIGHAVTGIGYCTNWDPLNTGNPKNYIIVHDNWSTTGTNVAIPWANWNATITVDPAAPPAVCRLIPNVPDENQPPASGSTNWCAPTAAVNVIDYWDTVQGWAPGLMNTWARSTASDSLGWFMDTNNGGSPARGNQGSPGTMNPDIGPGIVDYAKWGGVAADGFPTPFSPNSAKSEWSCFTATDVALGWDFYVGEIDSGYPLVTCFNFWNPAYSGVAFWDSAAADSIYVYQWGDSTDSSDEPDEDWNALLDIGHAVTSVGYCLNFDPDGQGSLPLTNWVVVHDNWSSTRKNMAIPWGHWAANVSAHFSALSVSDPAICHWPRHDDWWIGDHIWDDSFGLHCEVHNRGNKTTRPALVNFYYTDPTPCAYAFDPDLEYVGSVNVPQIEPANSVVVGPVPWSKPTLNTFGQPYWTIMAIVESSEDPARNGWPQDDNNAACKTDIVVPVDDGDQDGEWEFELTYVIKNPHDAPSRLGQRVNVQDLSFRVEYDHSSPDLYDAGAKEGHIETIKIKLSDPCGFSTGIIHVMEDLYNVSSVFERTTGGIRLQFQIDEPTLLEVQQAIADSGFSWTAASNDKADLIWAEKCELCGLIFPPEERYWKPLPLLDESLPSSWDWRNVNGVNYVSPVKDQGQCGSCWAFAGVGTIESMLKISGKTSNLFNLSEQFLVSCSDSNFGCDGGYPDQTADFLKMTGTPDEDCFAYCACDTPCDTRCSDWDSRAEKITNWQYITQRVPIDVSALKTALLKGPLFTTLRVFYDFFYYDDGVYRHVLGPWVGNHAVAMVGYDDNQNCFIVKNSWGTTEWGESENGYFKIAYSQCHNRVRFGQFSILMTMGKSDAEICSWPREECYWQGSHLAIGAGELRALMKNVGLVPATNIVVTFYYQSPGPLSCFPDDSLRHIGSETVSVLLPGDSVYVGPIAFTPPATNSFGEPHWSYLVALESDDDPISTGWPRDDNNIACQNFWSVQGDSGGSQNIHFFIRNPLSMEAWVYLSVDRTELPQGWEATLNVVEGELISLPPKGSAPVELTVYSTSRDVGTIHVSETIFDEMKQPVLGGLSFRVSTVSEFTPGDPNGDGKVNVIDAILTIRFILELDELSQQELLAADCDQNGVINVLDVLGIVNVILGIGTCPP